MRKFLGFLFLGLIVAVTSSCNIDDVITTPLPPKILLDSESGIYTVKQGRELVIAPNYEYSEGAEYCWTMDGEVLSTEPSLSFMQEQVGSNYITITISNEAGTDEEEIRVDVIGLEVPTVSIAGGKHQTVVVGTVVNFTASVVETSLSTTIAWSVNGEFVCSESNYTLNATTVGQYNIAVTATNEDGAHTDSVVLVVLNAEDMPFVWEFDRTTCHTTVGRRLLIAPSALSDEEGIVYSWQIKGESEVICDQPQLVFTADSVGEYNIIGTASSTRGEEQITLTREFVITVYEVGAFYRARSAASKADWNRVYEFTPAPGQFVGEVKRDDYTGEENTPEDAVAYAERRMEKQLYVSLGGFGGYIIVGFDHSIDNSGDYDLEILGNSFNGSSEPGIVWVMQDENGDGLPNDTWYELAGSETGKEETIQNYAVTYYRPSGVGMAVQWTDNQGNSGQIDYLKPYHWQDYYYPQWIKEDSYTLTGTCLKARNYDASGKGVYWVNPHYDWGYVDNWSPIDRLAGGDNAAADVNANYFKLSNAVDFECKPIDLKFVDFVKVQVGVNAKSGWLGEISTEVFGFYDYNMKK